MENFVKKEYFLLVLVKVKKSNTVLTNSEKVKRFLFYGNIVYFTLLLISVFLAVFFNLPTSNIWTHPVSDLGSSKFTPIPFMFDLSCIWAGVVIIPVYLSMKARLSFISSSKNNKFGLNGDILTTYGSFMGVVGALGCIFVGVFSYDRPGPDNLYHNISTGIAFGGLTFSIFLFSLYILLTNTKIPNALGMYGLILPLGFLLFWIMFKIVVYEWLLLFSIVGFIVVHNLIVLK